MIDTIGNILSRMCPVDRSNGWGTRGASRSHGSYRCKHNLHCVHGSELHSHESVQPPAYTGRVVVISMGQIGNRAASDPPNGCRQRGDGRRRKFVAETQQQRGVSSEHIRRASSQFPALLRHPMCLYIACDLFIRKLHTTAHLPPGLFRLASSAARHLEVRNRHYARSFVHHARAESELHFRV